MSLKKNTLIVFLEKHSLLFLSFFSTLILARLLTPTEIGLVAVALGIAGVAHMFRDFGLGQYLVQERELTDARVKTAFTITIMIAWGLAGLLYSSSFVLVAFYQEPRLKEIIQVMALSFVMLPFGSIGVSLLRRDLLFKRLYFINTIPQILQTLTSIGLAYSGFSYMGLVYANLLGTAFTVILSILLAPSQYKRGISLSEFKHVAGYSTSAMATNLLIEINGSASDFILSRTLGFDQAALYSRAKGVLSLFYRSIAEALRTVALPELSRRVRENQCLQIPFFKSMRYITVLAWPFYGFLYFEAEGIILLLYGNQWLTSAPVLTVLALSASVGIIFAFGDSFIIALGLQHHNLHYQFTMTSLFIIWLVFASPYGLIMTAQGVIALALLRNIYMYFILKPYLSLSFKKLILNLLKSASVTLIALSSLLFKLFLPPSFFINEFIELMALATAMGFLWLIALILFRHDLLQEIPIFNRFYHDQPVKP